MSTAYTFQSPSVTLEKGAYRMRAPQSTRPGSSLSQGATSAKQPSLHSPNRKLVVLIGVLAFASIMCFCIAYYLFTTRFARSSTSVVPLPADSVPKVNPFPPAAHDAQSKYLAYFPHSGLHNQRIVLENALVLAKLLNRTLLVPFLRLGKPIHYVSLEKVKRFNTLSSEVGLEHCALVPVGVSTTVECEGYGEWTQVPWQWIVDLHTMGETIGVRMVQWNGGAEWMSISDADTLTLQDTGLYDFRFLDTLDDVSPRRDKYQSSVYIPSLAQAPEKLLQIGGVYFGAHLRIGDGQFKEQRADNARIVWWKLVHHVFGADLEETMKLEQRLIARDGHSNQDLNPPLIQPDLPSLRVPHPLMPPLPDTVKPQVRCRAPLHTSLPLRKLNVPIYIATDSQDPLADPLFSIYSQTFPCIFFLSDFTSQLAPLDALLNPYNQVSLKEFSILLLDAMVLARARDVVVTDGSTFGAFVKGVLWGRHLGLGIVQGG
ncbi:hypothetical protein AZE42_09049 [Rhizopogon vesiculosus]|uniref:Uncharacterized protein n=1 Tax=Rhizopogon vesiculosus TaxID=180088 RepID=A0A1J8Q1A9_9AGAM|nr:hypothetical protein AZE42_09049 [Rhizopogon vesiculosus]